MFIGYVCFFCEISDQIYAFFLLSYLYFFLIGLFFFLGGGYILDTSSLRLHIFKKYLLSLYSSSFHFLLIVFITHRIYQSFFLGSAFLHIV